MTDHTNYLGTLANYSVTSVTSGLEKAVSLGKTNTNSNLGNSSNTSKSVSMSGSFNAMQRHSSNSGDGVVPNPNPGPLTNSQTRERPVRPASTESIANTMAATGPNEPSVSRSNSAQNSSNAMNNAASNRASGQMVMQAEGLGVIKRIFHRYGVDFKFLILTSHQQLLLV